MEVIVDIEEIVFENHHFKYDEIKDCWLSDEEIVSTDYILSLLNERKHKLVDKTMLID